MTEDKTENITFFLLGTTDSTTRKLKVTKLFEGHEYNFKVFAENEIGESDPCASTEPIKAKLPFGKYINVSSFGDLW